MATVGVGAPNFWPGPKAWRWNQFGDEIILSVLLC